MARAKGRGRGRGARGGRGRGRGRTKKMIIDSDEDQDMMETSDTGENATENTEEEENSALDDQVEDLSVPEVHKDSSVEFNIDDDISQLVPPTFSTISKVSQPMLDLCWNQEYLPIGRGITSPNIHMCIACKLPIRLYGRLIPCKHIFCYSCSKQLEKCSNCHERVTRIEKAVLGNVHMCVHGGMKYGFDGCRRTYLSYRDLQAHFNHRHKRSGKKEEPGTSAPVTTSSNDAQSTVKSVSSTPRQNIPVHFSSTRSNLISVPLQGTSSEDTRPSENRGDRYSRRNYYYSNNC